MKSSHLPTTRPCLEDIWNEFISEIYTEFRCDVMAYAFR